MLDPKGRVVLVSGASRGIGAAIARHLLSQGYTVSLGARNPASLDAVSNGFPAERVHHARYDAEDRTSHEAWVAAVTDRFGRIDGLVNNAGIGVRATIETVTDEELDRIHAVNVKAPLNMIRLCLPALRASGSGRIVNIASLSGKRVKNDNVAYSMSKFAVMALTHSARRLGWEDGVRATAVCPSFVATDLVSDVTSVPRAEMIDPADLASLVGTMLALPNNAAVAELLVNCRLEDSL
jgi:NAD(P)-dependent dehydrogenase (short-subunit alcohol dehydrogenase family)